MWKRKGPKPKSSVLEDELKQEEAYRQQLAALRLQNQRDVNSIHNPTRLSSSRQQTPDYSAVDKSRSPPSHGEASRPNLPVRQYRMSEGELGRKRLGSTPDRSQLQPQQGGQSGRLGMTQSLHAGSTSHHPPYADRGRRAGEIPASVQNHMPPTIETAYQNHTNATAVGREGYRNNLDISAAMPSNKFGGNSYENIASMHQTSSEQEDESYENLHFKGEARPTGSTSGPVYQNQTEAEGRALAGSIFADPKFQDALSPEERAKLEQHKDMTLSGLEPNVFDDQQWTSMTSPKHLNSPRANVFDFTDESSESGDDNVDVNELQLSPPPTTNPPPAGLDYKVVKPVHVRQDTPPLQAPRPGPSSQRSGAPFSHNNFEKENIRKWLGVSIERSQCQQCLLESGMMDGTYLVRKSSAGGYGLSICASGNIFHMKILTEPDEDLALKWFVQGDECRERMFDSIWDLLLHYKKPTDRLKWYLTHCISWKFIPNIEQ